MIIWSQFSPNFLAGTSLNYFYFVGDLHKIGRYFNKIEDQNFKCIIYSFALLLLLQISNFNQPSKRQSRKFFFILSTWDRSKLSPSIFAADVACDYPDPFSGASPSFQQRLIDLSTQENETIRWERMRVGRRNKPRFLNKQDWPAILLIFCVWEAEVVSVLCNCSGQAPALWYTNLMEWSLCIQFVNVIPGSIFLKSLVAPLWVVFLICKKWIYM